MDLPTLLNLLEMIQPTITTVVRQAVRSAGSAVCAEVRLAMALRYLAGGSVWDIKSNFEVSPAEFYRSLWCGVDVVLLVGVFRGGSTFDTFDVARTSLQSPASHPGAHHVVVELHEFPWCSVLPCAVHRSQFST